MKKLLLFTFFLTFTTNCFADLMFGIAAVQRVGQPYTGSWSCGEFFLGASLYAYDANGKFIWQPECICPSGLEVLNQHQGSMRRVIYETIDKNHAGTLADPFVLTGCKDATSTIDLFVASIHHYFETADSVVAKGCNPNAFSMIDTEGEYVSTGTSTRFKSYAYSRATSCPYCNVNHYVSSTSAPAGACTACPDNGKKDGISKGTITSCYKTNVSGEDDTGYFVSGETEKCYYTP